MSTQTMNRVAGRRTLGALALGAVFVGAGTTLVAAPAEAATGHTYRGTTVQTPFGPVAVTVRVVGSKITKVTATSYPTHARRSVQINTYAIPRLQQEAVAAQSASIAGVSGASWTSRAFAQSLQSALAKAGLA